MARLPAGITIYTNDGATLLTPIAAYVGDSVTVDGNDILVNGAVKYTYSGNNNLKGLSLQSNSEDIVAMPYVLDGSNVFYIVELPPYETVTDPTPRLIQRGILKTLGNVTRYATGGTADMTPTDMITNLAENTTAINTEVSEQTDLIAQIKTALEGKAGGSGGGVKETTLSVMFYRNTAQIYTILSPSTPYILGQRETVSIPVLLNEVIVIQLSDTLAGFVGETKENNVKIIGTLDTLSTSYPNTRVLKITGENPVYKG